MRIVYEHWAYIFKNLWFILPFAVSPKESRFISFQADGPHLSSFVHSQPKVYARYASEQTYSCKNSMVRLSTKQKQHPPGNMPSGCCLPVFKFLRRAPVP